MKAPVIIDRNIRGRAQFDGEQEAIVDLSFTDETRTLFVTGLRNAHAMENQALGIMRPQVSRIENYPQVARQLEKHIAETEGQVARLDQLLQDMGESNSAIKDTALSMMGSMAALGHTVAGDEILKNSFANFAFENFEIASYTSLLVLAEAGQLQQATSVLQQNLSEEEAMADWLRQNLPDVTPQYAQLKEAGQTAKV